MRILVTRPQEDGEAIAGRLADMGHQALIAPLLEPRWQAGPEPDFAAIQAILATSANGIRALIRRTARRDLPVFAVGPQTAREAGKAGFSRVENAQGDTGDLAALIVATLSAADGALFHVRGNPSKAGLAEQLSRHGFTVRGEVLYDVIAADTLPAQAGDALRRGGLDAAMFFSPRSAEVFRACLMREGLDCRKLVALCISQAAAQALSPLRFSDVRIAGRPNQDGVLALVE